MKKRFLSIAGTGVVAIVLVVALLGCQTAKPNTAGNSIQTQQAGLAPNGDKQFQTIDFSLVFAAKDTIKSWKVEMVLRLIAQPLVIGAIMPDFCEGVKYIIP